MEEDLAAEFINLETELTIYELMLLLRIAAMMQEPDIREPVSMVALKNQDLNLLSAPLLDEQTLLQLAQQRRLIRLGLITVEQDGALSLTDKGAHAAEWWVGCLQDIREGSL